MSRKIGVFFWSIFLMYGCLFPQHTDAKEYGYKGKIKTVTSYQYSLIKKAGNEYIPEDTGRYYGKNTKYFNIAGNLDSMISSYDFSNYKKGSTLKNVTRVVFYYDSKGIKRSGYMSVAMDDKVTEHIYTYTWKTAYEYTERLCVKGDEYPSSENHYTLNKDYRDYKGEYKFYAKKDDLFTHTMYTNEFNKEGLITKSIETDLLTNEKTITRYEMKKTDMAGNSLIIWSYNNDEIVPAVITCRVYTYYPD
jgi:hypothetical protein